MLDGIVRLLVVSVSDDVIASPYQGPRGCGPVRLAQLVYLDAIIRHGSFHRAADALHVSQPTLSEQIRELEQDVGAVLLHRSPAGTVPTAVGQRVHNRVKDILASVDDIYFETNRDRRATVSMGVIPSVLQWGCLAALASTVATAEPRVRLQIQQYGALHLAQLIESGDLDGGCLTWTERLRDRFPAMTVHPLVAGRIVVAVAPGHPLASCRSVALADILPYPVVLFPPSYLMHEIVSRYLGAAGVPPQILYYSDNGSTLVETIHQGDAVGFLYELDTAADWAAHHDQLVRIQMEDLLDSVWLAVAHRDDLHGQRGGMVRKVIGSMEELITSKGAPGGSVG